MCSLSFKLYEQIWQVLEVLFRSLHLLMINHDCPLAFCHKKGEYFGVLCRVFVFRGSLFVFGWSLWSFRLYLGTSFCTYAFLALTLSLMGYSCKGEFYVWLVLYLFLVSNCLLIYIYELFIDICIYLCVVWNQEVILFTCIISTHAVMHFV